MDAHKSKPNLIISIRDESLCVNPRVGHPVLYYCKSEIEKKNYDTRHRRRRGKRSILKKSPMARACLDERSFPSHRTAVAVDEYIILLPSTMFWCVGHDLRRDEKNRKITCSASLAGWAR